MAGLAGRMSTVVKAKVSKLLDRAEDPAETLDYSYQRQVEQLQNVKKGIADVVTAKKRLQMQESTLQQSVVKLDTQARQALSSGNEELARTAIDRILQIPQHRPQHPRRKRIEEEHDQRLVGQVKITRVAENEFDAPVSHVAR